MSLEVTARLLGDPEKAWTGAALSLTEEGASDLEIAAAPRVRLEVDESDVLGAVLLRAADEFNVPKPEFADSLEPTPYFVAFAGRDKPALVQELAIVGDDGLVRWGVPFKEAAYAELVRSGNAGTLPGDPTQPCVVLLPPMGNGVFLGWSQLIGTWEVIRQVVEAMATAGGALAFTKQILDLARTRLGRGKQALETNYLAWSERGALPYNFADILEYGSWTGETLAGVLGCPTDEAEAILWAYGYAPADDGIWRRRGDEAAELLATAYDDVVAARGDPGMDLERGVKQRTEHLLETGRVPPGDEDDGQTYELQDVEVPLEEGLQIPCACGQCGVSLEVLRFYPAHESGSTQVKFRLSAETDHFVMSPVILGAILGKLA